MISASFINVNTGWVGCAYSSYSGDNYFYISRTTNGGVNWVTSNSQIANNIYFNNNMEGVYSSNSTLMKTTDGGSSWFNSNINGNNIQGLCANGKDLYVVGDYGMIMKGTDIFTTGIQNEGNIIPDKYFLNQNYPNPFNPTTKISFALPKAGQVTIKVFDVLGKEIETLVNESLKPGTYEAAFDGSNYPSGVYFYRLTSDGFVETKRMVLIK